MAKLSPSHEIIPHVIEGVVIHQRTRDAYIDAHALCEAAGKRRFRDYTKRAKNKRFLAELSNGTGIPIYPKARNRAFALIQSVRGGNNPFLRGTWIHPRLAIHVGQWLSVEFQVWVTGIVDDWDRMRKLLRPTPTEWTKQFPDELFDRIYRLHPGWGTFNRSVNPPQIVGHYINDFVWDWIAPSLRQSIELDIPRLSSGAHRERMHQILVETVGIAALQQHIALLILHMDASTTWGEFTFIANRLKRASRRRLPPPPPPPPSDQGSLF